MSERKEKSTERWEVIVVGGGAAGLMAAGKAAERGRRVLLLEKNNYLGEKLKISGGGRCNITNAEFDQRTLLREYGPAEQFLYSPFSQFGVKETFAFFESRGLPLVVEARKRAFPKTQRALDVFRTLEKYIKEGKVVVKTNAPVTKIIAHEGHIEAVRVGKEEFRAKSFVLATGGVSHPETGSTGDGFRWLKDLGHKIATPTPDIVPLSVREGWVKQLSGVSLSFMRITFFLDGARKFSKLGKVLFTHFGLSGPLILNSAHVVGDLLHAGRVTATIDCYPDTDQSALEKKVISVFEKNKNKMLKNIIGEISPLGTSEGVLHLIVPLVPADTKVHSITKEDRKRIVRLLKALPLTISGLMGYDRAVVADGGISLAEIDTKTMRSKLIDNLYIVGDLLHVSRPSGGYSLQLCWSTGYVAGMNA